jgi:hypothetical protein
MILVVFDTVAIALLLRNRGCNDIGMPFDYLVYGDDAHSSVSSHAKGEAARAML